MSVTNVETKGPHGPDDTMETSVSQVHSSDNIDEKNIDTSKNAVLGAEIHDVSSTDHHNDTDTDSKDVIIVTGADASRHLLPMRDDHDNALTFRSLFLASCLACFQAVMYQIYTVSFAVWPIIAGHHLISVSSSNPLRSPSKEPSSFSSHTSSAMLGLSLFLVATSMKLDGEPRATLVPCHCGSNSSSSSTQVHGVSKSMPSVPSQLHPLPTLPRVSKSLPHRISFTTCP